MNSLDKSPLISIITLNFNQIDVTCEFLESLKCLKYKNYEVILIDNASDINPESRITSDFPDVRFYRSEENLGFTGGNNLAFNYSNGEYIFIVNNDTEVTPDLLDKLLEPLISEEVIGITCPKIMYFDQRELIQFAGFTEINVFSGRNTTLGYQEEDNGQYDKSIFTPYAHGAAMLVKRSVIEKVGLFPDFFFIYYEELDFSARVVKAGYKIKYIPEVKIYHKESVTMGKETPRKVYYLTRNRILFMRRNSNFFEFIVFFLFLVTLALPKAIIKYSIKGRFDLLSSTLKAVHWNFFNSKNG